MESREGHFITKEEIEERDPVRLSDMLRRRSAVRVSYEPTNPRVNQEGGWGVELFYQQSPWEGWCTPKLVIDGRIIARSWMEQGLWSLNDLTPEEVLAMEVYWQPSQIPAFGESAAPLKEMNPHDDQPVFRGGDPTARGKAGKPFSAPCGAIVVWTESSSP